MKEILLSPVAVTAIMIFAVINALMGGVAFPGARSDPASPAAP